MNAIRPSIRGSFSESVFEFKKTTDQTLLRLRELILSGEFEPGARICEVPLGERLGMSRTPIRVALQQLRYEGLIEALPTGGFRLRCFTLQDVEDAMEVRGTLEGLAARLAAERGVANQHLARARELLLSIDTILLEPTLTSELFDCYTERHDALHMLLGDMAGSDIVRRQLEWVVCQPFAGARTFASVQIAMPEARAELKRGQEQHKLILDAVTRREGSRAESLAREHARNGRAALIHAVRRGRTDMVQGGALIMTDDPPATGSVADFETGSVRSTRGKSRRQA